VAVADRDDGALLSVQGTAADDVWVAGGGLGLGGAVLRHFDGDRWTEIEVDDARTLWWVTPDGVDRAWAVGEDGLIVHVEDGVAEVLDAGVTETLYGVWASAADDVWIVGENDRILHWDGAAFAPAVVPDRNAILFKVWGAAPDEVWAVGQRGTVLHWNGVDWTDRSIATTASLFTVAGCSTTEVYAVGGQSLYALEATGWVVREGVPITSAVNGVSCGGGAVLIAGNGGLRLRLEDGVWIDERLDGPWDTDYHGAWLDPDGGVWAAGGNFNSPTPTSRRGVLAHLGCPQPPGF
jgi:hypothetical protein